ncbi:MAG: ATP-dependent zinc metalloprotease FtsH [Kiritimatiellia bacterium]
MNESPKRIKKLQQEASERKRGEAGTPPSPARTVGTWLAILILFLLLFHLYSRQQPREKEISYYPQFLQLVREGRIKKCEIIKDVSGVTYVRGSYLSTTEDKPSGPVRFRVYVAQADSDLQNLLIAHGVEFRVPPQNPLIWQVLSSVLPVVAVFGLLYFLFIRQVRAVGHGALSFGKSRAKLLSRDTRKVTFENVAGIDEAKEEVQEIIEFLKNPKKFQKLGGRIPKGVLLTGPPGTGKTLLAKAIAGEADVPFFSISGSDFVEMFVGVGASRVRDMFEQAKRNAPCIIFIDEIDAVGRSRFSGIGGGHDEREQTLNALLVQMDGFETQEGIIIIAATNRPDVLDSALLRPGRFDRQIVIDLPTIDGREAILKMHAKSIKLAKDVDLRRLARGTPGFSGADLANLINEAALLAARQSKPAVEMSDLEEARDKVKWGRERRTRVLDEKEKRITAYHEAGHALVTLMVEESEPLHKITIIPRGAAYLGATMQLPERDRYIEGRKKLLGTLAVLMGGRVAEEIIFGDITSGAASDLKEATRIARLMVCKWGMSETLGPQMFGENEELLFLGREITRTQDYSEETARKIDAEINNLLRKSHDHALQILREHRDRLDAIAKMLLERETLDGREVEEIVRYGRILTEEERTAKESTESAESQTVKSKTSVAHGREKPTSHTTTGGTKDAPTA